MTPRIRPATTFLSLALVIVMTARIHVAPVAARLQDQARSDVNLILCLDESIQERFKTADMDFGGARVWTTDNGRHRFQPGNAKDLEVVATLDRARLQVILYLAGRHVLQPKREANSGLRPRRALQGPVLVSKLSQEVTDAPGAFDLWDEAESAFRAFQSGRDHQFAIGTWQFTARPVRASAECLRCHDRDGIMKSRWPNPAPASGLRVGDPLGAVLYGYRRLPGYAASAVSRRGVAQPKPR